MKIRMFLFPDYLTPKHIERTSPRLFDVLRSHKAKIDVCHWDGTPDSIGGGEPALVLASAHMRCTMAELVLTCAEYGHLLFYEDIYIGPYGRAEDMPAIVQEAASLLENAHA